MRAADRLSIRPPGYNESVSSKPYSLTSNSKIVLPTVKIGPPSWTKSRTLMEARDERRLLNLRRQLSRLSLLIIDELGFVPLSRTGAELLFEVFSQHYERGSILVTTNLPFDEWTEAFGSERLTGALLDRLTHHVHILEMNGYNYRLRRSRDNVVSYYSCNVATLPDSLPSVIMSVVHDSAAPVAQFLGAIDNRTAKTAQQGTQGAYETSI